MAETTDLVLLLKNSESKSKGGLYISYDEIEEFITRKNNENANTPHNPESINLSMAEYLIKNFALNRVFDEQVAEYHRKGRIHIHDLGMINRLYCGGHSLEYVKKYGLHLPDITSRSKPAKHAEVLVGHMVKMSSTLQSYYAGAVGWEAVNLFFAPYFINKPYEYIKQIAQMLIFEFNQLAGARGSQVVFSDFNLYYAVPFYYEKTPAIGPGGKYMVTNLFDYPVDPNSVNIEFVDEVDLDEKTLKDKITGKRVLVYKDFEKIAQEFLRALYEVYLKGDAQDKTFFFPKPLLHINPEFWNAEGASEFLEFVCKVSAEKGIPYFIFEREGECTISQCCRLRMKLNATDLQRAKKPETLRFSSVQNVTINLPQIAYEASDVEEFFNLLSDAMNVGMRAHLQKYDFIQHLRKLKNSPLKLYDLDLDGEPYITDDRLSFIFGMIGLNEAVKHLTGKELHESDDALKFGLKVVAYMSEKAKEFSEKYGFKVVIEESPAESASYRLAKIDLNNHPDKFNGFINNVGVYYTNSIHLNYSANIPWSERIFKQGLFHQFIDGGAIIHIWLGEHKPSASAIKSLVEMTYYNTKAQQIAFSPEFTVCEKCSTTHRGIHDFCPACQNKDVYVITRVVGYFSRVDYWNAGKKAEFVDRRRIAL